jgi:hypothetical protein
LSMLHLFTQCALTMVMFCAITPVVMSGRPLVCLPAGIKPDMLASTERSTSDGGVVVETATVSQLLTKLGARCKKGLLVDGKGREIYFLRLIGCWGNPPEDYQELLEKQNHELGRLKKRYTVIEIPCSQDRDPRRISL